MKGEGKVVLVFNQESHNEG